MVDCSICFEEGKEIVHLPCFHNMCNICYIRLYDNTNLPKCPFCKHPLHINTQEELDLYNANMQRPRQNNNELASILRQLSNIYRYAIENDDFNIMWNFNDNAIENNIENENNDNEIENEAENNNNEAENNNENHQEINENHQEIINQDNHQENIEIINIPELVELDDEQIIEMDNIVNHINSILF
jgi:hypothetical protein